MRYRYASAAAIVASLSGMAVGGTTVLFPAQFNLSTLLPENGGTGATGFVLYGIGAGDRCGWSVSSAGDVNDDGIHDLIIGAPRADPNGSGDAGECYVVFGGAGIGAAGSLALSSLNGADGFVLKGIDADDRSGVSVSAAGDVNDDGIGDLIIGASRADPNGNSSAGESYVVFGGAALGAGGVLNLSSLNGANGFVLNGIDADDRSGSAVSSAGDVNGDGVDDLIIGAYLADPNGNSASGATYVVFGGAGLGAGGVLNLSSLNGANGFVLNGMEQQDRSGVAVATAGDLNNDGIDDLVIGAYIAGQNGNSQSGESYVVFGGVGLGAGGALNLSTLNGANGFVLNGIDALDWSGSAVSSAGDVNGDGVDDLIIGAFYADSQAGESYLVFGRDTVKSGDFPAALSLASLDGANGFVLSGVDILDFSGVSVSSASDVNGDGIDDLIIGAWGADPNGNSESGESYVVFGGAGLGAGGAFNLTTLTGVNGFVLNGIAGGDLSGGSATSAGDVNGDGVDDLIIGAPSADPFGNTDAGESYVVFGRHTAPPLCPGDANGDELVDFNDISSVVANWQANYALISGPGDANGDGVVDLNDFNAVISNWLNDCP